MKKILIVCLVVSLLLLNKCTSWESVKSPEPNSTIKITTNEDKIFEMSNWTEDPEYFEGFAGETKREGNVLLKYQTKVYKSDIKVLEEQKYDGTKTLWFGVGAVVGAFVLMSVIFLLTYDFSLDQ